MLFVLDLEVESDFPLSAVVSLASAVQLYGRVGVTNKKTIAGIATERIYGEFV